MIGIVDYGLGNVQAFLNIYKNLNIKAMAVHNRRELAGVDRLILPGVGSFDWAMEKLIQSGMKEDLDNAAMRLNTPVLGVCVGMQIMARSSEEGQSAGLSWIPADVKRFSTAGIQLPHMGWNDVKPMYENSLFKDIEAPRFYFLHSYYFLPDKAEHILSLTDYCGDFASSVEMGNLFGTQFHPEKSHAWGIKLLKNFAEFTIKTFN
jgi:glutamine amidotransferase